MNYDRMPLFPPQHNSHDCLQLPLFDDRRLPADPCGCGDADANCRIVRLYNPCCRGEYADVELCVDGCGNLSVCVHRGPGCRTCEKRRIPCCGKW